MKILENIKKIDINKIIYLFTFVFVLLLPYFIFQGKLFIGGDDTRLIYAYPGLYLKNVTFYSWFNLSSMSMYNSPQFMIPFALISLIISFLIKNKILLDYLFFVLPLLLGYIFFNKLFDDLIVNSKKYKLPIYLGSIFYLGSPIILQEQLSVFLSSVWLIGLIPILLYYFIRYLKTKDTYNIFVSILYTTFLSIGVFAIPWVAGFLIAIVFSLILLVLYIDININKHLRRAALYLFTIFFSQFFWFLPVVTSYIFVSKNNIGGKIFSTSFLNTFSGTVLSTASGNIIYPLLDLFHRQIAFDFGWPLKYVFINFYDKFLFLDIIYIFIIFVGMINVDKLFSKEKIAYKLILLSFVISLFFFTVNIGPLKNVFILLGNIPGFVMFRNFYDKFALGFVIYYASLITFSLVIIARSYPRIKNYLFVIFLVVVVFNIIPIKQIINKPLWTTNKEYTDVNLSAEYLNLINRMQQKIQPTSNILEIPFNNADYAIIKEDNSNNAYVGTSPMKIFTEINDFSGDLSFNALEAQRINKDINTRNYKDLNEFMYDFNIDYVLLTKNIPNEIKQSYLFNGKDLGKQDSKLISAITSNVFLKSEMGNYVLYAAKKQKPLFYAPNIKYEKINPTMYKIYIGNLKGKENLVFNDAYNSGWKLYLSNVDDNCFPFKIFPGNVTECKINETLLTGNELSYLVNRNLFSNSHLALGDYSNDWVIDANYIKSNFSKNNYSVNRDGSINFELTLYFYPQLYFYIGTIISGLTFLIVCLLLLKKSL